MQSRKSGIGSKFYSNDENGTSTLIVTMVRLKHTYVQM